MFKMKKIYIILFALLLVAFLIFIFVNPFKKKGFDYLAKAEAFLATEQITYDSLAVDRVDTLTEMKYARMTVELLEQMRDDYEYAQYSEPDEHRRSIIAMQVNEIEDSLVVFIDKINAKTVSETQVVCYLIYAHYCQGEAKVPFTFFLDPVGEFYLYDPFNTQSEE